MRNDTNCAIYATADGNLYAVVKEPTGKGIGKYDWIVYAVPDAEGAGYRMLADFAIDPAINDDWTVTDDINADGLDDAVDCIGYVTCAGNLVILPHHMGCAGRRAFCIRYDD